MRVLWIILGVLTLMQGAGRARCQPPMAAGQLVREVIYNEQHDHERHGYWRYWVQRRAQGVTRLEEQVETADGPATRLDMSDNQPLSPQAQRQEQQRLEQLLVSPNEQARHLKQYDDDEERIGRILALLPASFVYEYDGEDNGCYRLKFRPNVDDTSHSIESRIFHAMSGMFGSMPAANAWRGSRAA